MRPLRLELRGFTSFRESAVVDFEGRRLFAITGPTGAGKSSLLDAITWALYGEAPRVGRATRQLITHGARSMAVRFDFSVRGERYRVSRQAPGSIGTRLERLRPNGEWLPLADRAREVSAQVTELIGLDFATFTKTVLLPQGEFDEFLRGDEPQRRDILSRLLALGRYEDAGRAARNRSAGASEAARTLREQIERLHAATPEAIASLEREHAALAARVAALEARTGLLEALEQEARTSAEAGAAAARAEIASAGATRDASTARDALAQAEHGCTGAQAEHDRLEAERAALGYDEQAHRRLEREAALLEQREAAVRAVDHAEAEQRAAIEEAGHASEQADALRAEAERTEAASAEADEAQGSARDALAAAAGAALATERALGEQANEADEERASAEAAAVKSADEARQLSALAERLGAQGDAVASAAREHEQARESSAAAGRASEAANVRLRSAEAEHAARAEALEAAQRQNAALTLQRSLKPGDPCPVCGEPIEHIELHPAPALDDARAALDAAEAALAEAREEQAAAAAALAAAGASAMQMAAALERAQAGLAHCARRPRKQAPTRTPSTRRSRAPPPPPRRACPRTSCRRGARRRVRIGTRVHAAARLDRRGARRGGAGRGGRAGGRACRPRSGDRRPP